MRLRWGGPPAAFGAENYELTPEEEGGLPDTQAGSHPFQLTTTLTFNNKAVPVFNYQHKEVLPEVQPVALTKDLRLNLPRAWWVTRRRCRCASCRCF